MCDTHYKKWKGRGEVRVKGRGEVRVKGREEVRVKGGKVILRIPWQRVHTSWNNISFFSWAEKASPPEICRTCYT